MATKVYADIIDYTSCVTVQSSDGLGWHSVRLSASAEKSNDVKFNSASRNVINVTLTGTAAHETDLDGRRDNAPSRPLDTILIPAGLTTQFRWKTHAELERGLTLEFENDLFARYCPEVLNGHFQSGHLVPTAYTQKPVVASLVQILARELTPETRRGRLFAETVIRLLALEIAGSQWTRKPFLLTERRRYDPRICKAIDYIAANFAEAVSLHDLTRETGLHASQLIALFRRDTNQTPHGFLLSKRIEYATTLLRTTDLPLAIVAIESGFSNQQHMTRVFQKRLATTPRSVRFDTKGGPGRGRQQQSKPDGG